MNLYQFKENTFFCIFDLFLISQNLVEYKLEGKYICILGFDYQYFKLQMLILEQIILW